MKFNEILFFLLSTKTRRQKCTILKLWNFLHNLQQGRLTSLKMSILQYIQRTWNSYVITSCRLFLFLLRKLYLHICLCKQFSLLILIISSYVLVKTENRAKEWGKEKQKKMKRKKKLWWENLIRARVNFFCHRLNNSLALSVCRIKEFWKL